MSRHGRKLSPEEAALWARVARTVAPLDTSSALPPADVPPPLGRKVTTPRPSAGGTAPPSMQTATRSMGPHGLDAGWDRKLARGLAEPDFTLDLHGCTLDTAHARLLHGLSQARAMGARLVLLVTGKPRPGDPADRMTRRGAIRAKVIDWLAVSDHASDIAAIRGAHRRHGGQGALYIILKRRRA